MAHLFGKFGKSTVVLQQQSPEYLFTDNNSFCPTGYEAINTRPGCSTALQALRTTYLESNAGVDLKDSESTLHTNTSKDACREKAVETNSSFFAWRETTKECKIPTNDENDLSTNSGNGINLYQRVTLLGESILTNEELNNCNTSCKVDNSARIVDSGDKYCTEWASNRGWCGNTLQHQNNGYDCRRCSKINVGESADNLKGCHVNKNFSGLYNGNELGKVQHAEQRLVCKKIREKTEEKINKTRKTNSMPPVNPIVLILGIILALGSAWYVYKERDTIRGWFSKQKGTEEYLLSIIPEVSHETSSVLTHLSQL